MPLTSFEFTKKFERDFKALDPQHQALVETFIRDDLLPWPVKGRYRLHSLQGYDPPIYSVDIGKNHAYKLTFRCDGANARLLRVATHKQIDANPGD